MPVVMMSGHGTIDRRWRRPAFGAFEFPEKPIALQKAPGHCPEGLKHAGPVQRPP